MSIKQTTKGYLVDVQAKGYPRIRKSLSNEANAILLEAQIRVAISQNKSPKYIQMIAGGLTKDKPMRSNSSSSLWRLLGMAESHYAGTKDELKALQVCRQVVSVLGQDLPAESIDRTKIKSMISYFNTKGNSNKTINKKLSALSVMLELAYDEGLIDSKPSIKRLPESKGKTIYYTDEMLEAFFSEPLPNDLRWFFTFLLDTGCRLGEAFKVTKENIIDGDKVIFQETKSDKPRIVPLTNRLKDYVKTVDSGKLFASVKEDRMREHFNGIKEKLGWSSDYVLHTFRHTCATRLVRKGVHIVQVKEWLGHSNINTTMIYVQFAPDHLQDAVAKLQS